MSLGNLGDLGNLDLGQLQQYLPDVNFPAGKEEVLSNAQSSGAPQEVLDRIREAAPTPSTAPRRFCRRYKANCRGANSNILVPTAIAWYFRAGAVRPRLFLCPLGFREWPLPQT